MLVTILKPFPYAEDGIHARDLEAGAVEDIVDDCVPGLVEERFVSVGHAPHETKVIEAAPETGEAVEITADKPEAPPAEFVTQDVPVPLVAPIDPYPNLSPAQEAALDRDGDKKPGGSRKGGRKARA